MLKLPVSMKIALAQVNPIIGDFDYNFKKAVEFIKIARQANASLVIFPEMFLLAYPPQDLLLKDGLIEAQEKIIKELLLYTDENFALILGGISLNNGFGKKFHNSIFCLANKEIQKIGHKTLLPSYDVFDETRYFEPAKSVLVWDWAGIKFGLSICEDIWIEAHTNLYKQNPINELIAQGSQIIVNISASPYSFGKAKFREEMISKIVKQNSLPLIYVNQVGANDQLVFDGNSLVYNNSGDLILRAKKFQEDCLIIESEDLLKSKRAEIPCTDSIQDIEAGIILGIQDYVNKCNFDKIVLGLSGGIDSALVAYLCAKALGAKNIFSYMLPSEFTSQQSIDDASLLASNLGINFEIISIRELHASAKITIPNLTDLANENLQARLRALILMGIANSKNAMLIATSNKSEIAVGYSTLYGDSCGAIAPIGDLLKSTVYELSMNIKEIPKSILDKAPSAELRFNQKDSDSLPEYSILDPIIDLYVQQFWSYSKIIAAGHDEALVKKILNMIDKAEYKRKQSPPVIKVTGMAFGMGRRMPIAQHYSHK